MLLYLLTQQSETGAVAVMSKINTQPLFMTGAIFSPRILRPDTNGFLYMAFKTDHVSVGAPMCDLLPTNLVKDLPWPQTFFFHP